MARLTTAPCKCGQIFVFYQVEIDNRQCITCRYCGNHFTFNFWTQTIILYVKEQQCPCYEIKAYKTAEGCCYRYICNQDIWYDASEEYGLFCICPQCWKVYWIDYKVSNRSYCLGIQLNKPITNKNFIAHYITWCRKNSWTPLQWNLLNEIFFDCESNDDYKDTLNALFEIQNEGFKLNFMNDKQLNSLDALKVKLKIRLELFKRIPSGNNMLLAYALIEEITLKQFAEIQGELDDKLIDKFDKCKALALNTKYIAERQVAFNRSLDLFKKFSKVEI